MAPNPEPAGKDTLVENGTFGRGTRGWTAASGTDLAVGSVGRGGSAGAMLSRTDRGDVGLRSSPANDAVDIKKGDRYVATGYLRVSDAVHAGRIRLRALNTQGVLAERVTTLTLSDTSWHRFRVGLTAPSVGG